MTITVIAWLIGLLVFFPVYRTILTSFKTEAQAINNPPLFFNFDWTLENYAIAPGVVDGEHWDGVDAFFARHQGKPGHKKREVGAAVPYRRMGRAEGLTGMAVFLASKAADYIVAQCYNVDGGQWMS